MSYDEALALLEHAMESNKLPEFAQWLMRNGHYKIWMSLRDAVVQAMTEQADIETLRFLFPKNRDIGYYKQWEIWNEQERTNRK